MDNQGNFTEKCCPCENRENYSGKTKCILLRPVSGNCTQLSRLITLHETTSWEGQEKFLASHGCVINLEETSDLIKHEFSKLIIMF